MSEFMEYIIKPLEDIAELSEEYARMPVTGGEACMKEFYKTAL